MKSNQFVMGGVVGVCLCLIIGAAQSNLGLVARIATLESESLGQIVMRVDKPSIREFIACDGSTLYKTKYPELFQTLDLEGDSWKIPDLRGRFPLGEGKGEFISSGREKKLLTTRENLHTGGFETHRLSVAEMPNHFHNVNDPAGYKEKFIDGYQTNYSKANGDGELIDSSRTSGVNGKTRPLINAAPNEVGDPHENMPPFCVVSFYIKVRLTHGQ